MTIDICITGWYGTETVGDRAILDGIFQIFQNKYDTFHVSIGSLYPIVTERTLLLDKDIFCGNSPGMEVDFFDVRKKTDLADRIKKCDYCIMGGGPIMDSIKELNIVLFAFKAAKRFRKKTILFGVGLGPLRLRHYQAITKKLFACSDLIIFRSATALLKSRSLFGGEFTGKCHALSDPAVLSVGQYLKTQRPPLITKNEMAINLRAFPKDYENYSATTEDLCGIVKKAADHAENVRLVPMHTFFIGGDDRKFLTEIAFLANRKNITVLHKPLNIHEAFSCFADAGACIGMRYHSVVFQTLLNGNNFILDYTNRVDGKIVSFVKDIDKNDFYVNRRINLADPEKRIDADIIVDVLKGNDRFVYNKNIYPDVLASYCDLIGTLD